MNRVFKLLFLYAFLLFAISCKKKDSSQAIHQPIDFSKSFAVTSDFDQKTSILTVNLKMDEHVHAYAQGERIGKPLRLEIVNKNGWQAIGDTVIPEGAKKKLGDLGESRVLEGEVKLKQELKKGSGPGEATLYLQICTDNVCDRPRTQKIVFP